MKRLAELMLLLTAALTPMFYMAGSVSADEVKKGTAGAGQTVVVFTAYKLWAARRKCNHPEHEESEDGE